LLLVKELVWTEVLLNLGMFLSLFLPSELGRLRLELAEAFPDVSVAAPSNPLELIQWLFNHSDQARLTELDLERTSFLRWVHVAHEINRSGINFEPKGAVRGALMTVFCAIPLPSMGTREEFKESRLSAWREFSGDGFEMIDVDGEHYTMLSDQHVFSFAEHTRDALRRAASRRAMLDSAAGNLGSEGRI
jgi:thioesterase domain-containing protein